MSKILMLADKYETKALVVLLLVALGMSNDSVK